MLKIIAYRIINSHTVTHKARKRKNVHTIAQVEDFERKTAERYTRKTGHACECWAIFEERAKA